MQLSTEFSIEREPEKSKGDIPLSASRQSVGHCPSELLVQLPHGCCTSQSQSLCHVLHGPPQLSQPQVNEKTGAHHCWWPDKFNQETGKHLQEQIEKAMYNQDKQQTFHWKSITS